jgi:hypothetical protein
MDEEDPTKEICSAYLEINPKNFTVVEYLLQYGQKREFTFSALKQVEKSYANYRLVKLIFSSSNLSNYYLFSSVLARQKFLELAYRNCFKVQCKQWAN